MLRDPFRPEELRVDGKEVPDRAWSYDRRSRVLHVSLRGKRLRLVARDEPT